VAYPDWQRFALLLIGGPAGHDRVVVYLAMQARQVQAFVQPVQLTEEGKMVLIGVPQDLLAYQPQDSDNGYAGAMGDQAALARG